MESRSTFPDNPAPEQKMPMATDTPANTTNLADAAKQLQELKTSANLKYSLKQYDEATELYSKATEIQAQVNGEMAPENGELLFRYGRSLYKLGVSKSDVLGGQVAGEKKKQPASQSTNKTQLGASEEELVSELASNTDANGRAKEHGGKSSEPFQPFLEVLDNPLEDDEDDEDDEEDQQQPQEEDDDLANAYEILDVARVLFEAQLQDLDPSAEITQDNTSSGKGKGRANTAGATKVITEAQKKVLDLLADARHLQGEISLENERFLDAFEDFKASLNILSDIHPFESELIAEGHYMCSLALEFASVTKIRESEAKESTEPKATNDDIDHKLREQALEHMELAIKSCRSRISAEEENLKSLSGPEAKTKTKKIQEVKEIAEDMEQRLTDLRAPGVSLSGLSGPAGAPTSDPLSGVLGQVLGESSAQKSQRVEEATKNARDLTGLVRHKKKPGTAEGASPGPATPTSATAGAAGNGTKRKLTEEEDCGDGSESSMEKKKLKA